MKLANTIFITGASSGLGKATARLFQSKGWNVIATMRTPEKEAELNKLPNILIAKLDVTNVDSIQTAVTEGIQQFGKIDVLVNNAGYGAYGSLESFSKEKIFRQFDTNVFGMLEVIKAILPHFRQNKSGTVINISSVGGKIAYPLGVLYHGAKFAVEGISESLYYELNAFGVKVKVIEPGFIDTNFAGSSLDFQNDESLQEYQPTVASVMESFAAAMGNKQAISRPEAIADVIYSAATDNNATFRYAAGKDAEHLIKLRKDSSDEEFMEEIKTQFHI